MGRGPPPTLGLGASGLRAPPPMSMLPTLMGLMGIHLPPSAAGPLVAAVHSGHISPAMMQKLGAMLMGMHVPAATVSQIGLLMSGPAPHSTLAGPMNRTQPSSQAA